MACPGELPAHHTNPGSRWPYPPSDPSIRISPTLAPTFVAEQMLNQAANGRQYTDRSHIGTGCARKRELAFPFERRAQDSQAGRDCLAFGGFVSIRELF